VPPSQSHIQAIYSFVICPHISSHISLSPSLCRSLCVFVHAHARIHPHILFHTVSLSVSNTRTAWQCTHANTHAWHAHIACMHSTFSLYLPVSLFLSLSLSLSLFTIACNLCVRDLSAHVLACLLCSVSHSVRIYTHMLIYGRTYTCTHTHTCTPDMHVLHATMHMVTWFSFSLSFFPSFALQHKRIKILFTGTRSTRLHTHISYIHSLCLSAAHTNACTTWMHYMHPCTCTRASRNGLSLSRALSLSHNFALSFSCTHVHIDTFSMIEALPSKELIADVCERLCVGGISMWKLNMSENIENMYAQFNTCMQNKSVSLLCVHVYTCS